MGYCKCGAVIENRRWTKCRKCVAKVWDARSQASKEKARKNLDACCFVIPHKDLNLELLRAKHRENNLKHKLKQKIWMENFRQDFPNYYSYAMLLRRNGLDGTSVVEVERVVEDLV